MLGAALALATTGVAAAASGTPSQPPAAAAKPAAAPAFAPNPSLLPYSKFTDGAKSQTGLFTVWRKDGQVALELRPDQLNKDYVELGVPVNGIGDGLFSGFTDLQNCRIIRFVRQDNRVAILMPSTHFFARDGSPEALAVAAGQSPSVVGVAKVLSENPENGAVVFDASAFLQDVTNVADFLTDLNGGRQLNPMGSYRLDPQSTYFGKTKAFPDNVVVVANQTFSSMNPEYIDNVPDGRNIQIQLQYDIAELPKDDGYMPRFFDDRVGYFANAHNDFSNDNHFNKDANYIIRFNVQPADPTKRLSPAKQPVVYYLSDTIPMKYRGAIRSALLEWNKAFERIGISNAVIVRDQPNDPSFDPDDIRYNVIRWLAEENGGFAEAQLLYNPYTGEMIKSGVVIDSDIMRFAKFQYPVLNAYGEDVQIQHRGHLHVGEAYAAGEQQQFGFGLAALSLVRGDNPYNVPDWYANQFLKSIVLHESGHDFGLRHNFIGTEAYTAQQIDNQRFTQRYGVANSVMEYSPINISPKGKPQGDYWQTALGPYDYYVIKWGYARVPGARSPQDERATLDRWAANWSNPQLAYSSDEDVSWGNGMAYDPRNQQYDLTNDNIGWCENQMTMSRNLYKRLDWRFPRQQASFDDLRTAFSYVAGQYGRCATIVSRYVGGEYVSRSLRGDRNVALPLTAIPRSTQVRAFKVLEKNLFSADAWNVSPRLLREMVTQYRYDDWNGNFAARHDIAVETIAARYQMNAINRMFLPTTLQRLDDMSMKYRPGQTMDIADLFTWMQSAVYNDVGKTTSIPLVRRNLQRNYAALLTHIANQPLPGTPNDAQSLARYQLGALHTQLQSAMRKGNMDLLTRAHLAALDNDVERALSTQTVIQLSHT